MHSATAVTEVMAHMHPATAVANCTRPFSTWRSTEVTATAATSTLPATTDTADDWTTGRLTLSATAGNPQTNLTGRATAQDPENQWAAAQAPGNAADVCR